jgi:regulator of RNase E activity RraA
MTKPLSEAARAKLMNVSTATLTTLLFKRGLRNVFIQGAWPLNPEAPQMVGPAYTLRYIPAREDLDVIEVFQDRTHPQRAAVEAIPPGSVLVMDCRQDASVASAGSILITRMMVRGAGGVVSDGGLRDSHEIAKLPFPTYCQGGSAPTNLIKHHAVDLNVPIGCGGVAVYPGDVLIGDRDGVLVIPRHLVAEIAEQGHEQEQLEAFVSTKIHAGEPLWGNYPPGEDLKAEYKASLAAADEHPS